MKKCCCWLYQPKIKLSEWSVCLECLRDGSPSFISNLIDCELKMWKWKVFLLLYQSKIELSEWSVCLECLSNGSCSFSSYFIDYDLKCENEKRWGCCWVNSRISLVSEVFVLSNSAIAFVPSSPILFPVIWKCKLNQFWERTILPRKFNSLSPFSNFSLISSNDTTIPTQIRMNAGGRRVLGPDCNCDCDSNQISKQSSNQSQRKGTKKSFFAFSIRKKSDTPFKMLKKCWNPFNIWIVKGNVAVVDARQGKARRVQLRWHTHSQRFNQRRAR